MCATYLRYYGVIYMVTLQLEKKKQRGTALVIPLLAFLVLALMPGASAYTATLVAPTNLTNVHNGDLVSIQVNSLAQNNTFQLNISSADLNTTGGTFSINNFAMPFGFVNTTASTSLVGDNLNASGLLLVVARADGVTISQQNQTTSNPYRIFMTNDILKTTYNVSITGYPLNANGAIIDFSVRGNITTPDNPAFLNFTIYKIQSGHLRIRVNDGTTNQLDTNLTITPDPDKIGIFRDGVWYLDNDGSGTWNAGDRANVFGTVGWTSVFGDWNGDGKSEIGIFKDGTWYLDYNGNGMWDAGIDKLDYFGTVGYTPVIGNWNGDATGDKIGIFKDGAWYLDNDGSGTWNAGDRANMFGTVGWIPVVGNWNGDSRSEIGIFKDGTWYLDYNGNGMWDAGIDKLDYFGTVGYTPVLGNWNGDATGTKIGIYRNGAWYLDNDGSGTWNTGDQANMFGTVGWTSAAGDWNGDGRTKIGIFRDGTWYLDYNGNGMWDAGIDKLDYFGTGGWTSLVGKWS